MALTVIYEDNHLLAVEKAPGELAQPDSSGEPSLLDAAREYIRERYRKPGRVFLGPVNRLDRQVSGIMLFARTSKAARRLHAEFSGRRVVKRYIALVESGASLPCEKWLELEDRLVRGRGFTRRAESGDHDVKTARLRYTVISVHERVALLVVDLLTGRKHQIRAQLGAMGMPVAGDTAYGSSEASMDGALLLHAAYLRFAHPTRDEEIELVSPLPPRFNKRMSIDDRLEEMIRTALRDRSSP